MQHIDGVTFTPGNDRTYFVFCPGCGTKIRITPVVAGQGTVTLEVQCRNPRCICCRVDKPFRVELTVEGGQ